ncbi:hypothetical protein PEX1_088660 [Penicillium expansum]|uniref:Uncharacterized protein n=1 Tax=Penicillium expansum TaxID=27334 RepID=A0A0A2ISX5_PENEN|nr:hypothetical protein PEX2_043990 [Penicillium expansum]KGO43295.1 hypothetical protein PEX1_088660 [Penicillium expansum]KGO62876.1 hypothetical protein PEX2_043990 [Penicillium expansum]
MESTQPSADADENMRLAIERFRTKMEASNWQFLQDRIDEIESMDLSTEEKLKKMNIWTWIMTPKCADPEKPTVSPETTCQSHQRTATQLIDLKSLSHENMDGVIPPKLWTDEWRQVYLDTIQTVCNEVAFRIDDDTEFEVPPCHDLALFLKYASGIVDADFRYDGMAPFEPPGIYMASISDISKAREDLVEGLHHYYICDEDFVDAYTHDDLEVRVGFQTGTGVRYKMGGHSTWYSMYLYCRRWVEDSDPSHKDWAWRVVISPAEVFENSTIVYGQRTRFDSIVDFLDWYSSWLEYVDMDEVRANLIQNDLIEEDEEEE